LDFLWVFCSGFFVAFIHFIGIKPEITETNLQTLRMTWSSELDSRWIRWTSESFHVWRLKTHFRFEKVSQRFVSQHRLIENKIETKSFCIFESLC
jgi:hypothetical protein